MRHSKLFSLNLVLLLSAQIAAAQLPTAWKPYDAITYFCQRWYHQSVVKDNTLFVYGGIQSYNLPSQKNWTNSTLGYNPYLLQVNLTESWDWRTNISYVASEVTEDPNTHKRPRDAMYHGTMFHGPYNDTKIYMYGGSTFRGNETFLKEHSNLSNFEEYPLWSGNAAGAWNSFRTDGISTPSYGAATEAPDQGLAFYMNGRTDNGTSPLTSNDGTSQTLLDGMVVIDTVRHSATNISVAGMVDSQPRIGGALQYVPGVGIDGVLVAIGGQVFDGKRKISSSDKGRLLDFNSVDVFDINSMKKSQPYSSGAWYKQYTSGFAPEPRIDFCTIIASAPDNSSHNIWVYGGRDPTTTNGTTYFDDTYVLSLPSFSWVKMHQGYKPRWGHTCHRAGGNQMITVGGHNEFANICDWHTTGVGVLNLQRAVWGSLFQAGGNSNLLNYRIVDKIGGTQSGNASLTTPEKGWASDELGAIMHKIRLYDNYSGTLPSKALDKVPGPPHESAKTKADTIIMVGAGAGGVVLIACFGFIFILYRRYQRPINAETEPKKLDPEGQIECADNSKFELRAEHGINEAIGSRVTYEVPGASAWVEADAGNAVTYATELPTTNFGSQGRWGVPFLRTRNASEVSEEIRNHRIFLNQDARENTTPP